MKHSDIWKRDSTTEGDKLFTQINGEWLELKPISPEDIKTLKEALEWHQERYIYINKCIDNVTEAFLGGAVLETQALIPKLLSELKFHTRIAESLRRVVG